MLQSISTLLLFSNAQAKSKKQSETAVSKNENTTLMKKK